MRWMKNSAGGPSTWTGPSAGPARGMTPAARTTSRHGPRKNPRNKRSTAASEAALRGAAAGCRPVRARRTQSGLHDGWRILWRPRKAAALKLRRRQGRESRPRCRIKGECFILWPPARRHPGRPTAASAAGGGESLRPLCLVRPGRGFHVGRKARIPVWRDLSGGSGFYPVPGGG